MTERDDSNDDSNAFNECNRKIKERTICPERETKNKNLHWIASDLWEFFLLLYIYPAKILLQQKQKAGARPY